MVPGLGDRVFVKYVVKVFARDQPFSWEIVTRVGFVSFCFQAVVDLCLCAWMQCTLRCLSI